MLPRHDDIGMARQIVEACSIAVAVILWILLAARLGAHAAVASWWWAAYLLGGMAAADLASGVVHWAADTWGRVTMPFLGRRLLHPFRVHHVNPDDLLRRSFLDANGDVALIAAIVLATGRSIPVESSMGLNFVAFLLGLTGIGMWTNQIHQWAHMPQPPRPVRWLQSYGVILSHQSHRRHHQQPHVSDYCITSGWCNGWLNRVAFFRRAEQAITWATGCRPRVDETAFMASYSPRENLPSSTHHE